MAIHPSALVALGYWAAIWDWMALTWIIRYSRPATAGLVEEDMLLIPLWDAVAFAIWS